MTSDQTIYEQVRALSTLDRRSARLREIAYQAIKDAILYGVLSSAAPLIEERLAAVLQISRTPVREALAILEHEGLLEQIAHKGVFVRQISAQDFELMYEAAETGEQQLAAAAARQATPAAIRAMEATLAEAAQAIPADLPGHFKACREFQRQMGLCAGNAYLTAFLLGIEERSDLYLISTGMPLPSEKLQAAVADRQAILAAIRAGDPEAATAAARTHMRAIRERWRDHYGAGQ